MDLVDNPEWNLDPDYGGFSFLEPEGRRYYLPAAMVRSLRNPEEERIAVSLRYQDISKIVKVDSDFDSLAHFLEKWSALDTRQRSCLRKFLGYKSAVAKAEWQEQIEWAKDAKDLDPDILRVLQSQSDPWMDAYESYWSSLPETS